jgi:hypothetical protein
MSKRIGQCRRLHEVSNSQVSVMGLRNIIRGRTIERSQGLSLMDKQSGILPYG